MSPTESIRAKLDDLFNLRVGDGAKLGLAPGQVRNAPDLGPATIRAYTFTPKRATLHDHITAAQAHALVGDDHLTWIDVVGVHDGESLNALAEALDVHALAMEDVQSVFQRPKVEAYPGHLYIVVRIAHTEPNFDSEQISIVLGSNYVITFQERDEDCFQHVRRRLDTDGSRVRRSGPDYLAYALIDAVVDHFFPVLETFGDRLEELEEVLLWRPSPDALSELHDIRRELLGLRKAIWPLRDAVNALVRDDHPVISAETRVFLRDAYDHTVQVIDVVETFREMAAGLVDLYMSSVSNKMNDIMKILTIITTIFVPLSFIAGLYGMNFDTSKAGNMPELAWPYGYVACLAIMATIGGGLLVWFWRKGWIFESLGRKRR